MRGIRVMAGLLTVLIGSSMSESAAQGLGANQPGTMNLAGTHLLLDGVRVGAVEMQTPAGFEVKLIFPPQNMHPDFFTTWVAPALQGQKPLKTIRIVKFNEAGHVLSVQEATGIAPRQIDFPALVPASSELHKISVSFSAPNLHPVQATYSPFGKPPPMENLPVRFDIQGSPRLDTSRVSKIEAISVGPKGSPVLAAPTKSQAVGGKSLAPEIRTMTGSGGMAVSNLVFYLPQQYAAPFQQWFASSSSYTRNGSISYLKTNGTPWIILALNGLAIAKITTEPTTGADGIRLVKVEMTVGSLQLTMPH